MSITADDNMARPIDSLLWATAMMVRRVAKIAALPDEVLNDSMLDELIDKDEQMRQAYMVALKLRSGEVVNYAASIGIKCTARHVKDNPFLVALAIHLLENSVKFGRASGDSSSLALAVAMEDKRWRIKKFMKFAT